MSRTAVIFLIMVLVITSCFIAGCSSLPFTNTGTPTPAETPRKENAGLVKKTSPDTVQRLPDTVQRFQLDSAVADILADDSVALWNEIPENISQENLSQETAFPQKHIQYIRGANLDENGDASSWTFIVDRGDRFSIVTYSYLGMKITDSPGRIARTEIFTDKIISPRELFEKNRDVISGTGQQGTAVSRDLTLGDGIYTLTITGQGTPRVLAFDAKTGALISTNE
jgi:hypothetical protein